MDRVLPLVKKYGGAVVALCIDENGIAPTAEGRVEVAEKIIKEAALTVMESCQVEVIR